MAELKSRFEVLLDRLKKEGVVKETPKDVIFEKVEKELNEYRFENQKKIRESQEQIATIILTA
jgi:hypothetical protein